MISVSNRVLFLTKIVDLWKINWTGYPKLFFLLLSNGKGCWFLLHIPAKYELISLFQSIPKLRYPNNDFYHNQVTFHFTIHDDYTITLAPANREFYLKVIDPLSDIVKCSLALKNVQKLEIIEDTKTAASFRLFLEHKGVSAVPEIYIKPSFQLLWKEDLQHAPWWKAITSV